MLRSRPFPALSPAEGGSEGGSGRPRRRPACDCGDQWGRRARACGLGGARPRPPRPGSEPLRRSGAEQLYFILETLSTNKRVRQRLV